MNKLDTSKMDSFEKEEFQRAIDTLKILIQDGDEKKENHYFSRKKIVDTGYDVLHWEFVKGKCRHYTNATLENRDLTLDMDLFSIKEDEIEYDFDKITNFIKINSL